MSLISMHGAWLSFSDAPLLDNAELHIEDNERVCLVGRNGAGKSTLMKILNREQGLDDGRIIYEQDLIVARLQQDPPRNVEGSVYDFVAEGIEEQAEYLKRYHDISRLVMNDPSEKNLNELAKVQEQLDHHNLWQLENRINEVLAQLGLDPNVALSSLSGGWLRKAALGRALVAIRAYCCSTNRLTTWILKPSTGWKGSSKPSMGQLFSFPTTVRLSAIWRRALLISIAASW